ncbi:MAG: DUF3196 family protein [Solobacterium sp.]|nr:DUF3196 family protein [Solobacterium sp.]
MNEYYRDLFLQLEEMMEEGHYEEANYLIEKELHMPYLPQEVESKLQSLKKDAVYYCANEKETKEDTLESLLNRLRSGKPASVLYACEKLCERNLRSCIPEIQDFLRKDPLPEAAALLIDALAEQEIQEEFILKRQGLEFTFYGDSITPVSKSAGLKAAMALLEEKYYKNPSFLQMARTLLIHTVYLYLPLSYEESDAPLLVKEVEAQLEEIQGI